VGGTANLSAARALSAAAGALHALRPSTQLACHKPRSRSRFCWQIRARRPVFDQLAVNRYVPGEGLKQHVDLPHRCPLLLTGLQDRSASKLLHSQVLGPACCSLLCQRGTCSVTPPHDP
jgi:hypothetical protein